MRLEPLISTMQICHRCFRPKDIAEFGGRFVNCDTCRAYHRLYGKRNINRKMLSPEQKLKLKTYYADYYQNNKEHLKAKTITNRLLRKSKVYEAATAEVVTPSSP